MEERRIPMRIRTRVFLAIALAAAARALPAGAGEAPHDCPMKGEHSDCPLASGPAHVHGGVAEQRADEGMGFAQARTIHHFRLAKDGGAIEVTVRDAKDAGSLGQIRAHLAHVRTMFAGGDFSVPMFVHGTTPPGAATMKRRASAIRYGYEEIPGGGRVSLSSSDPDALDAIHDFLRFQIVEHETGDPVEIAQGR